jgi:uncharacterized membrane protein YkoI
MRPHLPFYFVLKWSFRMQIQICRSIAVVAIVALSGVSARAGEEKVKASDLPKSVMSSLNARFPGLTIISAAHETENGKEVFDIELKQKERKFETDIQKDGTILEIEKEIFAKDWSSALRSTIESKFPNGKIKEVLEVNKVTGAKEVPHHLEVTVEAANKTSAEILVSLDGKTETHEEAVAEATKPAADEDIKPSDLPPAVTEAVKAKFPQAEIKSAEKSEEGGKPIIEVTIINDKHSIDVTLSPKGEILSMEKTLKMNELPKVMKKSLNSKYPHSTVKVIEEVWEHDKLTGYEGTIITTDKKSVEVNFDPKGKLIEAKK